MSHESLITQVDINVIVIELLPLQSLHPESLQSAVLF